jgi:gentisate 1,2-dioxygenase
VRTLLLGPATLATFDRTAVYLEAGARWQCPRDTVNRIFTVIDGNGTSTLDGKEFDWGPGDMMTLPSWYAHTHNAVSDAVLLQVSDAQLLSPLNWVRSENQPNGNTK